MSEDHMNLDGPPVVGEGAAVPATTAPPEDVVVTIQESVTATISNDAEASNNGTTQQLETSGGEMDVDEIAGPSVPASLPTETPNADHNAPSEEQSANTSASQPLPHTVSQVDVFSASAPIAESSTSANGPSAPTPAVPVPEEPTTSNGPRTTAAEMFAPAISPFPSSPARPTTPPKMDRTGFVYDPLMMLHCPDGYTPTADDVMDNGDGHPEEPMRIKRIFSRLAESGLISRMRKLDFGQVTFDQALLVHSEDHWQKVQGTETLTDQYIQESKHYYDQLSLYVCRETAHCARLSCGGVIQACLSVCKQEIRNAFAIVRPPGHHAEPEEHMGFCFYNNVAVAAKVVMKEKLAKKVLILDWDVHHGNGTQRAFWNDPNVLYVSIHRHDRGKFYPTSDFGALDMVGQGEGEGKTVNIPWPSAGFGDADYIYAFQKIVMPIAYEFAPDLVIISAGFDAAEGDALGGCNVTPAAYGHMTHMLCALAGGKVVVALEGGYNLEAISRSSLAVAQVLLGETPAELGVLEASEVATEVMYQVARVQSKYWKSIDVKACEPPEVTDETGGAPIPIPDLLKIHRAHHLFDKHSLFQIPFASQDLEDAFGGQVICSETVYEAGTRSVLVVFVHDFGNLRVETDGVSTTNVHMTNSYLLDTSDKLVDWITKEGYNLIDINVLAQLPTQVMKPQARMITKEGSTAEGQLMKYIWDNYIELSEAENVVLIGHGTGCRAIMDLINHRDIESKVKAVVQVAGMHSLVRIDPANEGRREWFKNSNRVYLPSKHPVLEDERAQRRLGGQIFTSKRAKVVDVLVDVLPEIETFIQSKLPASPGSATPNGEASGVNGHIDGAPPPPPTSESQPNGTDVAAEQTIDGGPSTTSPAPAVPA